MRSVLGACRGSRIRFDYRKACWMLVEVRRVRFYSCNVCWIVLEVGRVRFDYSICRNSVLTTAKRVRYLWKFGGSVFTTAKRAGGL